MLCLLNSVATADTDRESKFEYDWLMKYLSKTNWTVQCVPLVARSTVVPLLLGAGGTTAENALCRWLNDRNKQKELLVAYEFADTETHCFASTTTSSCST